MANLKLIKVTGLPFTESCIGRIGIEVGYGLFDIITAGGLNRQLASNEESWRYATAEEIAENWKIIYPNWKPESGDNVIVTQDYRDWTNVRGTIVEESPTCAGYWYVKREDGNIVTFDYTTQMIIAPTISKPEEPKETAVYKFKVGDRIQCLSKDTRRYLKTGTVVVPGIVNAGVEFDEYVNGHSLEGRCKDGHGWYVEHHNLDIILSTKPEPKEESKPVTTYHLGDHVKALTGPFIGRKGIVRQLKEGRFGVEFHERHSEGHSLNGHCRDCYGWYFFSEHLEPCDPPTVEAVVESKISSESSKPARRFKVGDKVSYKSVSECEGRYYCGGLNQVGFVGTVLAEYDFIESKGCYQILVSSKGGLDYTMLESEFYEYDGTAPPSKPTESTKPEPKFFVGKPVTYKSVVECGGYHFGGECHKLFVGTVKSIQYYVEEKGCYAIKVTCKDGYEYTMLESEFEEYHPSLTHVSPVDIHAKGITISSNTSSAIWDPKSSYIGSFTLSVDPLASYKQVPITIKAKPKSKLQVI